MPHATRDDLSLYYEQAGFGDPAYVFVHGWCCDHTFFEPQYEHFQATSSVMTYDLRGCGQSDRPSDGYDIRTLADDLAWLCDALEISRPIVVGHSLGGLIGLDLAARHPSLPAAIVAVDPGPIDPLPQSRSALTSLAERLENDDDPRRDYVAGLFLPTDDLDRGDRIAETMCSVPPNIAAAVLRGYLEWSGVATLERCDVPLLVLLSKTGGSNDPARLLSLRPDIQIAVTVGAGHFHQLDAHEQVTAMIERFVRIAAYGARR